MAMAHGGLVLSTPRARDTTSEHGKVLLPGGIELVRKEDCMAVIGPTGQQMEIRPLPSYDPVRNTPRSVFVDRKGACSKLKPRKQWMTGSLRWAKVELSLEKFTLSWGDGSLQLTSHVVIETADRASPRYADCHHELDRPSDMGFYLAHLGGDGAGADGPQMDGVVGRDFCLMIHTPRSLMDRMHAMIDRGHTIFDTSKGKAPSKEVDDEGAPTSFYFSFSSDAERSEWKEAIERNLRYCESPSVERAARSTTTISHACLSLGRLARSRTWRDHLLGRQE